MPLRLAISLRREVFFSGLDSPTAHVVHCIFIQKRPRAHLSAVFSYEKPANFGGFWLLAASSNSVVLSFEPQLSV